jgi:hypothetical protein
MSDIRTGNKPTLGIPRIRHEHRPPSVWGDVKRLELQDVTRAMRIHEDGGVNDHDRAREVITLIDVLKEIGLPTHSAGYTAGFIADVRAALQRAGVL